MSEQLGYYIVVVDDEAISLTNVRLLLEGRGMRVNCLKSGRDLLRFMKNHTPDLILLDVLMPEMGGFETLEELRKLEDEIGRSHTPVIFLTGENDSEVEQRGLSAGASDFVRKSNHQDILVKRIQNTIVNSRTIGSLTEEATVDALTGFLNKANGTSRISGLTKAGVGAMVVMDLDSFKLVNDLYGHDMGDKVLRAFADIVRRNIRSGDVVSRIGGDEFLAFFADITEENAVASMCRRLNSQLHTEAVRLMGADFMIPLGISIGAVMIPEHGTDFEALFALADAALYDVKQNGKHGYRVHAGEQSRSDGDLDRELEQILRIVEERSDRDGALLLGTEAFTVAYRFARRLYKTNGGMAVRLLVSLSENGGEAGSESCALFGQVLQNTLRKSDIITQNRPGLFFIFLPDIPVNDVPVVMDRIMTEWRKEAGSSDTDVRYVMKGLE